MSLQKPSGQPLSLSIQLEDEDGNPLDATSATWTIYDQDGVELSAGSATLPEGTGSADFTIGAEYLTTAAGAAAEGREIVVRAINASTSYPITIYLVVTNTQSLTRFSNTVVTYTEALAIRHGFGPTLDAWDAADDKSRLSALINAFYNLSRVAYAVSSLKEGRRDKDYAAYGVGDDDIFDIRRRVRLTSLDQIAFDDLPQNFKNAIKRAQIVEADVILGGDQISKIRESGIISETIGESSTFYNSKPFMNLPMSRRAYDILKSYIPISVSIAR